MNLKKAFHNKQFLNFSGRILNRFSKDIGFVDDVLPLAYGNLTAVSCRLIIRDFLINYIGY